MDKTNPPSSGKKKSAIDVADSSTQIPQFVMPVKVSEYEEKTPDDTLANRILGLAVYFSQMIDAFSLAVSVHRPTASMHAQIMITLGVFGKSLSSFTDKKHHFLTTRLPAIYENMLQRLSMALREACAYPNVPNVTSSDGEDANNTISSENLYSSITPILQLSSPLLAEITGDVVNSPADAFDGLIRASWATLQLSSAPDAKTSDVIAARLERALILLVAADRLTDVLLSLPQSQRSILHDELKSDGISLKILQSYREKMGSTKSSPTHPFKEVATTMLDRLQWLSGLPETVEKETGVKVSEDDAFKQEEEDEEENTNENEDEV